MVTRSPLSSPHRMDELAPVIERLGYCLHTPMDGAEIRQILFDLGHSEEMLAGRDDLAAEWDEEQSEDPSLDAANSSSWQMRLIIRASKHLGLLLASEELTPREAWAYVADGFPVVVALDKGRLWLLERVSWWRIEATDCSKLGQRQSISSRKLRSMWGNETLRWCVVAQRQLSSNLSIRRESIEAGRPGDHDAGHPTPFQRLVSLLRLELRDLLTVVLFALISGVLGLATPLAVESLVNTVAWGTYLQPLFVLSMILFGFLGFAGLLKLLQVIIVEVLERRLFVRIVGDLAHRFPLAKRSALAAEHPSELANRYFDIMTIQKATGKLVMDGISIVLQTAIGLVLLAVYHPYLLGFDLVLLLLMTVVTFVLGRGGVRTAIDESRVKYEMAHWLQDLISMPTAFRMNGGSDYAIERANYLTVEYLMDRRQHFQVLLRQYAFSLTLLAVASTALLGVGGWLVIRGELTLGQLVASELVVTAIVGAFAKIGKSLESFYDLLAAVEKVGHMLDLPYDRATVSVNASQSPARIRWQGLGVSVTGGDMQVIESIEPGTCVCITGSSGSGKSRFLETLAGFHEPERGFAEIAGVDARDAARANGGTIVSLSRQPEVFFGSLLENVRLGRSWLTQTDVRQALEATGLWEKALQLPSGLNCQLQTGGYPLDYGQCVRLMLARSLVSRPSVLLIDGILDLLTPDERWRVWTRLKEHLQSDAPSSRRASSELQETWDRVQRTIVIATHDQRIVDDCDGVLNCTQTGDRSIDDPFTGSRHH